MGSSKTPEGNASEDQSDATVADLEGEIWASKLSISCRKLIKTYFLEYESVSEELDNLNGILETMENNVDNIKDQLLSILMSNREILKELKDENEKAKTSSGGGDSTSGTSEPQQQWMC